MKARVRWRGRPRQLHAPRHRSARSRRRFRHRRGDDSGQLTLLFACYLFLALVAFAVAVDASKLFLRQRTLASAADGAALAAARDVQRQSLYGVRGDGNLPLADDAADVVNQYARDHNFAAKFRDFRLVRVDVDAGGLITVIFSAKVSLPLVGVVDPAAAGGVTTTVTAHAGTRVLG